MNIKLINTNAPKNIFKVQDVGYLYYLLFKESLFQPFTDTTDPDINCYFNRLYRAMFEEMRTSDNFGYIN